VKTLRLIQAYYLGSPLFFLFGLWWGMEIRVSFIQDPGLRFGYYVLITALGLLTHFKPNTTPWVAVGESSLNLILIFLWILLPIYQVTDISPDTVPTGVPYTPGQVLVNGLFAGSFFVMGFYRGQAAIVARFPWLAPGGNPPRH
jgi:hypothetical protein